MLCPTIVGINRIHYGSDASYILYKRHCLKYIGPIYNTVGKIISKVSFSIIMNCYTNIRDLSNKQKEMLKIAFNLLC